MTYKMVVKNCNAINNGDEMAVLPRFAGISRAN